MIIWNMINKIFRSETWDKHKKSVFFLLMSVLFFSFLPIWITLFVMFLTGRWASVENIWNNGSLFIYSAAVLGSAIEMMDGYSKRDSINFIRVLYHFTWALAFFSAIGFVIAIIPNILSFENVVETRTIVVTSFIFVVLSLFIIYYAHYYSNGLKLDPEKESRKQQDEIMDQLS